MLCLTRRPGERIYFGDDTFIEFRKVRGNAIHVAIHAPDSVTILRGELWLKAQEKPHENHGNGNDGSE